MLWRIAALMLLLACLSSQLLADGQVTWAVYVSDGRAALIVLAPKHEGSPTYVVIPEQLDTPRSATTASHSGLYLRDAAGKWRIDWRLSEYFSPHSLNVLNDTDYAFCWDPQPKGSHEATMRLFKRGAVFAEHSMADIVAGSVITPERNRWEHRVRITSQGSQSVTVEVWNENGDRVAFNPFTGEIIDRELKPASRRIGKLLTIVLVAGLCASFIGMAVALAIILERRKKRAQPGLPQTG
jgi:hypothetical protein